MRHGWIIDDRPEGGTNEVFVEFTDEYGARRRISVGHGEDGARKAVEWWDKRVGKQVSLKPFIGGGYIVHTEE